MLSKCPCQNCGVNIEFDAEAGGQFVACPACNGQTRLIVPGAANKFFAKPYSSPEGKNNWLQLACVLIVGIAAVLLVWHAAHSETFAELLGRIFGAGVGAVALAIAAIIALWALFLSILWTLLPFIVWIYLRRIDRNLKEVATKLATPK